MADVYAVLFTAYGWNMDTVKRLTVRQAELWCMKAREEQERTAERIGASVRETMIDLLSAAGLLRRA